MAVVEIVENLRQLEGVLGQISGLSGGDALVDQVRSLRRRQPQFPKFVAGFSGEVLCQVPCRDVASYVSTESIGIEPTFAKNVGSPDYGILRVRPGLAFEAQRLLEIECDHRRLGELEHEIAQRANGDLRRDGESLRIA